MPQAAGRRPRQLAFASRIRALVSPEACPAARRPETLACPGRLSRNGNACQRAAPASASGLRRRPSRYPAPTASATCVSWLMTADAMAIPAEAARAGLGHRRAGRAEAHGDQIKRATAFLPWLSGHGITLPACRQADIDVWHAGHNQHGRNTIRACCDAAWPAGSPGASGLPAAVIRQAAVGHEALSRNRSFPCTGTADGPAKIIAGANGCIDLSRTRGMPTLAATTSRMGLIMERGLLRQQISPGSDYPPTAPGWTLS